MRVIFPQSPLNEKEADDLFQEEYLCLKSMGVECSLFDFDMVAFDEFKPKPPIKEKDIVLYRGWMMNPSLYNKFVSLVNLRGGKPVTSYGDYVKTHHLPNWYNDCEDFTAQSAFFPVDEQLEANASKLGWGSFFVKDYVKSNYNERGSIANSTSQVTEVVNLIKEHRGEIEGGIALRRVEDYLPETEQRFFVMFGKPYSPTREVPDVVKEISKIVKAPFYSVDVIQRVDGVLRVVELGDGQVSDRKMWDTQVFCEMVADNA
ncbi:MAG: ATP-grasp domain-containing protein [Gammaproteobacteria bacterium]|nr:ATP-grasp domain-containing protein [Gammaproteobacteria bacterium]MDH5653429.1 ATP-grasp domain-containing protein [Gammaproteobacteria bacterium]